MVMFKKPEEYLVISQVTPMIDFHNRKGLYVTRPPYQRKVVWSTAKQKALLDSIFRGYYIPRLVLRQVTIDEGVRHEVIDGQQRITVVQLFFNDELALPPSLRNVRDDLPGKTYSKLPDDVKAFIDYEQYDVDLVLGIENPYNDKYQAIATEIFRRLQEGESLTYMEKAHARLNSLVRNFLVKYADDISFDFDNYQPLDKNGSKHPFLRNIYKGRNDRMQHLAFLCRLLIFEEADGPADIKESDLTDFVTKAEVPNGIGDFSYEGKGIAKSVLGNLNFVFNVFKDAPQVIDNESMKQFETEYFALSVYLLLRHLKKHYVINDDCKRAIYDFVMEFYEKWKFDRHIDTNRDILTFVENRQQSKNEIESRHQIIRQHFFDFAAKNGIEFIEKDSKRAFNEAERIRIYRKDRGICQMCVEQGLSLEEALVPWRQYEADHVIPHSQGGLTIIENGQVLCRMHNRMKNAKV